MDLSEIENISTLVKRIKEGETELFQDFYKATWKGIFYLFYSKTKNEEEAKELVQETFINVYRNISSLQDDKSYLAWLYKIARNKYMDYVRKNNIIEKVENIDELEYKIVDEDYSNMPENVIITKELRKDLLFIVRQLPVLQKSAIIMFYYQGMSTIEIAEAFDVQESIIRKRLFDARNTLKKIIEKQNLKGVKLNSVLHSSVISELIKEDIDNIAQIDVEKDIWNHINSQIRLPQSVNFKINFNKISYEFFTYFNKIKQVNVAITYLIVFVFNFTYFNNLNNENYAPDSVIEDKTPYDNEVRKGLSIDNKTIENNIDVKELPQFSDAPNLRESNINIDVNELPNKGLDEILDSYEDNLALGKAKTPKQKESIEKIETEKQNLSKDILTPISNDLENELDKEISLDKEMDLEKENTKIFNETNNIIEKDSNDSTTSQPHKNEIIIYPSTTGEGSTSISFIHEVVLYYDNGTYPSLDEFLKDSSIYSGNMFDVDKVISTTYSPSIPKGNEVDKTYEIVARDVNNNIITLQVIIKI